MIQLSLQWFDLIWLLGLLAYNHILFGTVNFSSGTPLSTSPYSHTHTPPSCNHATLLHPCLTATLQHSRPASIYFSIPTLSSIRVRPLPEKTRLVEPVFPMVVRAGRKRSSLACARVPSTWHDDRGPTGGARATVGRRA